MDGWLKWAVSELPYHNRETRPLSSATDVVPTLPSLLLHIQSDGEVLTWTDFFNPAYQPKLKTQ